MNGSENRFDCHCKSPNVLRAERSQSHMTSLLVEEVPLGLVSS